jgi:ATP-dependent Lhr-like helicase
VLLTTPESIEAMFLSTRVDARALFSGVRSVVVDEIHAFAGDDRGWHLLALLQRLDEVSRHDVQRVGLSATVGNPDELLGWITTGSDLPRAVVAVTSAVDPPAFEVDWVGSVTNAATIVASLHRGEKRLVFADSRARVEELATALRSRGVSTFVSHSSLSADDRRQAERAFSEARDCVIVATSTLELGIDVGDLDRVIQLGVPRTVASVLQRIGRTGRRPGTVRNCLFLATTDQELLQAFALIALIADGWVEPLVPPPAPIHLAAQQLLARVLSEGRVGRSTWPGALAVIAAAGEIDVQELEAVREHMVARDILLDLGGVLQIGTEGERLFGRRHFMDVTSLFLTEPLLSVRWGGRLLGQVDPSALSTKDGQRAVVLLGGQAWAVGDVDWHRKLVWVEPTDDPGRSRWAGAGGALSFEVCRSIRGVLTASPAPPTASRRAAQHLATIREGFASVRDDVTTLERDHARQRSRWWTFAGGRANAELAHRCVRAGLPTSGVDDLGVTIMGMPPIEALRSAAAADGDSAIVDPRRLDAIKFHEAVPDEKLERMVRARDADPAGVRATLAESVC